MMCDFALAQTFGVKIGHPISDVFQIGGTDPHVTYSFNVRPLRYGLTGELTLPAGLLLEIEVLYSRTNYASTNMGIDVFTRSTTTVNSWDFPFLVKKRFTRRAIKPYVVGGAAFRAVNADTDVTTTVFPARVTQTTIRPPELIHQATAGVAAGGGVEVRVGKLHVLPELRLMRFQRENFRSSALDFHSNLKQPEFLLGIQIGR